VVAAAVASARGEAPVPEKEDGVRDGSAVQGGPLPPWKGSGEGADGPKKKKKKKKKAGERGANKVEVTGSESEEHFQAAPSPASWASPGDPAAGVAEKQRWAAAEVAAAEGGVAAEEAAAAAVVEKPVAWLVRRADGGTEFCFEASPLPVGWAVIRPVLSV